MEVNWQPLRFPRLKTGLVPRSHGRPLCSRCNSIPARGGLNFDEAPFLAIWEVTQSCDLACKHCRAAAQPIAHPDQLIDRRRQGADRPDRRHACADLCLYGRRSAQAPRPLRADPLRVREGCQGCRHAQRHAAAHPRIDLQDEGSRAGAAGHLARRLDAGDSRRVPRTARRMGAHHPGHRMGQRGRYSHPGAHDDQPAQRPRPRQPLRAVREAGHRDVERVFPGSGGTRPVGRFAQRRGVRAGFRQDLRAVAAG